MATFVKKVSDVSYYEINEIRAAGIIPYYIRNKKIYILINTELKNKIIVYNCIGGKVDLIDKSIEETAVREFNEETGYIASDLIREKINNKKIIKLHIKKAKYISYLINVDNDNNWKLLPYNYNKIFNGVEEFNHRESIDLEWIDLFDFNKKNKSYLLSLILYNIKNHDKFKSYDPNKEPLFLDD